MKTSGNTILITGGGSGIGAALAERFHALGNTVIVAGRRRAALERVCDGRPGMHAITFDISQADDIARLARDVTEAFPALNVLINNAGIMRFEALDHARDLSDAEETIVTNLLGTIRLDNALIDHLVTRRDATIVTVTSGLAFVPLVSTPTYNATKAALHSYIIAQREALRGRVEIIELAPPGVQTDLTPGQGTRPGYMPLEAYIDEVMELFAQVPTPAEILVERVKPLRFAEANGTFDQTLAALGEMAAKARAAQ
ncbi:short-chain dehydrogenase [Ameyamaea chiangmaiensis NBRC 103196]|uniref:SDR family NAD(P)-dependent oxidoreductase n=1 Tax=Ameyamaea chiangmaiensis TaxID=442969 RepID=A0A850PJR9_9PROT|nr:SDR family oxidoreductase [Ameyamaea chiangmaiensis]MBS4073913.1 SDR family oxidoreductase [Ameyamaea chiangmaiensis]NVN41531.1 SDR family NAD(P)-dependent oxidoreductase [Ameyamaea chiangmaiensis]GBQ67955.1 short-chain dehydrogenase [Ameyamaea chiangmaiensis NBRC 103196]